MGKVIDAGIGAALAVIHDRLLAIPGRPGTLMPEQRAALRQEGSKKPVHVLRLGSRVGYDQLVLISICPEVVWGAMVYILTC